MRKAIIAAIVATALFAVGAFAASFSVQAEDVTSGTNGVDACAAKVDIDFTTAYNTTDKEWRVTAAVVSFLTDVEAATNGCANYDLELVLEDEGGDELETVDTTTLATGQTFEWGTGGTFATFTWAEGQRVLASEIGNAALLADGYAFNANVT
jgi:hypothetical protein